MTLASEEPHTPAMEAIQRVNAWLWVLARRYARRFGIPTEDFLHHIRVRILLRFGRYDPTRGSLTNWATWQARGVVAQLLRETPRRERTAGGSEALTHAMMTVPAREQTLDLDQADDATQLRAALDQLPERRRQAVALRFGIGTGDGMDYDAVGAALGGITGAGARHLVREAVGELREALGNG